jgi:hypothetical protein
VPPARPQIRRGDEKACCQRQQRDETRHVSNNGTGNADRNKRDPSTTRNRSSRLPSVTPIKPGHRALRARTSGTADRSECYTVAVSVSVTFLQDDEAGDVAADTRGVVCRVAAAAEHVARPLLAPLPDRIDLFVKQGHVSVPGTGIAAWTRPGNILLSIDVADARGVVGVVEADVLSGLVHEFHHLARFASCREEPSLVGSAVVEGLGTVFEREVTGRMPPWGTYDSSTIDGWIAELRAQPPDVDTAPWLFVHPDGRRWIAYRAGTRLVERACEAMDATAGDLVTVSATDIVEAALNA